MLSIKITDHLPKTVEKKMERSFVQYETENGINLNYQTTCLLLENENEVVGALNAKTLFAEIYIEDLWVDTKYRRQGLGRRLIATLEEKFQDQGYNNIWLETSHFQAPEFYKKCGFELEFVRINKVNPKLTKYFFIKYFTDPNQTQGIANP